MPIEIDFTFRTERFVSAEKGLAMLAKRIGASLETVGPPIAVREAESYLRAVAKALETRHSRPWPGGTSEKSLSSRSGTLSKSFADTVKVEGATMASVRGSIGSSVSWARIHETGGTITPRHGKYLAIPLPAALDAQGLPLKQSPRAWDHTFVSKSKNGNLIIFRRQGKDITPLYVLKTKVYIPPRLGMEDTLKSQMPAFVDRLSAELLKGLKSSIGGGNVG